MVVYGVIKCPYCEVVYNNKMHKTHANDEHHCGEEVLQDRIEQLRKAICIYCREHSDIEWSASAEPDAEAIKWFCEQNAD